MTGYAANRPLELTTIRLLGYMDCRPDEEYIIKTQALL